MRTLAGSPLNNSEVITLFKRRFGYTPTHVVRAPGRLELLGNHTDYNLGLVMGLAIDRYITMASSPRTDGRVGLVSSAFEGAKSEFSLTDIKRDPATPWADYVKGVLDQLRRHGASVRGFDAAIHSTIPLGSGLSSSAALEVCAALTMRLISPYTLTPTGCTVPPRDEAPTLRRGKQTFTEGNEGNKGDEKSPGKRAIPRHSTTGKLPPPTSAEKLQIALACQAAENEFVGVKSGLLDQLCCLFGKEFHAIEIDCQSHSVEHVPMTGEIAIVVCHTGCERKLVAGEYNELRRLCESAAAKLGASALRKVDMARLQANKERLSEREFQCARHIVGEIQRVNFGARALRENDFKQFGHYMFQSHESSRDYFKNSTPELDLLVGLARENKACLGARLTGGGFGGATINLVERSAAKDFMNTMAARYEERTGTKTAPMLCRTVDGASVAER